MSEVFSERHIERRYLATVFWLLMYRYVRSEAKAAFSEYFMTGGAVGSFVYYKENT